MIDIVDSSYQAKPSTRYASYTLIEREARASGTTGFKGTNLF